MPAVERSYAAAGAALVAAGAIAVVPGAPQPAEMPVASHAMRLVADDSLLNVPLNLFYDFVNIPYNEIEAVDFAARSLFFSGPWFVPSATNLWGVDPGDPSHFQAPLNFLLPFPALSGMNAPETDFDAGLGQQEWGLAATLFPVSEACDADGCLPLVPSSPITGITGIDALIWPMLMGTLQQKAPLVSDWVNQMFTALPQALFGSGFTFDSDFVGYADPSGPAYDGFGFLGTIDAEGTPDTPDTADTSPHLMPWADQTFQLHPLKPFENFFESLMAAPATDGVFGTGMHINPLDLFVDWARAMQAVIAAQVLAWDPFTPGSPFCPEDCSIITNLHLDYPDLVKFIGDIWPGNPIIDEWLTAYADGTANVPTDEQIDRTIDLLQTGFWDFGNPSPPPDQSLLFDPSTLAPFFHDLWTTLGFNPPPLADDIATPDAAPDPDVPDAAAVDLFTVDGADLDPAGWM